MNYTNEKKLEDLSVEELEEKLRKKKLVEELTKKAEIQSREYDASLIGTYHTCHAKIYLGDPIYKPHDFKSDTNLVAGTGGAGGVFETRGFGGAVVSGKIRKHQVTERWIQCGWCWKEFHNEIEAHRKWELQRGIWSWGFGVPSIIMSGLLTYYLVENTIKGWLIIVGIALLGGLIGTSIGAFISWIKQGPEPKIDRYKMRNNPNLKK